MTARPVQEALPAVGSSNPIRSSRLYKGLAAVLKHPQGLIGMTLIVALVLLAILAPLISWHDPNEQFRGNRLVSPNSDFIFGTDEFSRDIYARVLYGLRTSLLVGILSVFIGASIGSLLGYLGGFSKGIVDAVLSRFTDAMLAFPAIVSAIAIATALGRGNSSVAIAIAIFNVPFFARLARASALVERERDYVLAAQSIGAPSPRILAIHIIPNTLAPILVQLAFSVAFSVLLEAGLSFLGLGTPPPDASIGAMLNTSRSFMRDAIWYPIFPGLVIVLLLMGMNFLADAVNDVMDPRRRDR